jgi:hypothetical protein
MYKPSNYLELTYFPTYVPIYETYFLQDWFPRWNQIVTQMRFIHNWVSNNEHPVDGAMVGAGDWTCVLVLNLSDWWTFQNATKWKF